MNEAPPKLAEAAPRPGSRPQNTFFKILLKAYKVTLSPLLGPRCRFYPSCSAYALECFEMYDAHVALRKTIGRILRCHPFHPGGVDLP